MGNRDSASKGKTTLISLVLESIAKAQPETRCSFYRWSAVMLFFFSIFPGYSIRLVLWEKKRKRLPGLDKTPVEPSPQKLLENFGHEIPKNGQINYAQEPALMVLALG
jgi:hypothetical protein